MYDKKDFEAVIEAADILHEIESRVGNVKRVGSNHQCCCPFHAEKSPSFTVSPVKKRWKCFGCSEGGDVISFVSKYDNISPMEAMRKLAKIYGVVITEPQSDSEGPDDKQSACIALKIAQIHFASALLHNKTAKRYIVERGIRSPEVLKHWGIGWADDNYTIDADEVAMNNAGLVRDGKNFFHSRIMFPITDITGRVLGFGARDISGRFKSKYINTPDTIVYNKSQVLYGLRQALPRMKQLNTVIITEGYMDVINLHQIPGYDCSVATCGTALTKEQSIVLSKYAKTAVIMYDGDKAGRRASIRAIEILLAAGFKKIEVVIFPDGVDAGQLALESGFNASTFNDNVSCVSCIEFLAEVEEMDGDERIYDILKIISNSPSPLRRDEMIRELADLTKYSQHSLIEELDILLKRRNMA